MSGIIDFHSHILPGIDDGSASVAESIAMLRLEAEQGLRRVVATPHFYAAYDSPERFLEKRDRAEAALRAAMAQETDLPELLIGAEVYFFRGMSESEWLPRLTIREKHCILIEMPPVPWPEDFYRELAAIYDRWGIVPIVAHVERYAGRLLHRGILRKLEQLPVMIQANADYFLTGGTSALAMRMLKAGQIHLLGSDCHNLSCRKPNLAAAVERIQSKLGQDGISRILECQEIMLNQEEIFFE